MKILLNILKVGTYIKLSFQSQIENRLLDTPEVRKGLEL